MAGSKLLDHVAADAPLPTAAALPDSPGRTSKTAGMQKVPLEHCVRVALEVANVYLRNELTTPEHLRPKQ